MTGLLHLVRENAPGDFKLLTEWVLLFTSIGFGNTLENKTGKSSFLQKFILSVDNNLVPQTVDYTGHNGGFYCSVLFCFESISNPGLYYNWELSSDLKWKELVRRSPSWWRLTKATWNFYSFSRQMWLIPSMISHTWSLFFPLPSSSYPPLSHASSGLISKERM